ncbi:DUF4233 domain-containing protein [Kineosporia sp. J2-2]|uniref:DUF4233 domain-containing protein n=1 Tax=Kineosporia corallincola TaxID=2835133 RepID=A0ABS5TRY1_9ACTN|nr:DUF4233 domain-containing protein [Kineosporia corallincola]MBT0773566.1 DUF4233 domain-containing protein [Kineosporia corallincola]
MRNPTRMMAATTLVSEALVMFFAGLVAKELSSLSTGAALGITCALALACLLTAGMLRSRTGYLVGSVLQVLIFATGIWVHAMLFLGLLFGGLWVASLVIGQRLERESAERWALYEAEQAKQERDGEPSESA